MSLPLPPPVFNIVISPLRPERRSLPVGWFQPILNLKLHLAPPKSADDPEEGHEEC